MAPVQPIPLKENTITLGASLSSLKWHNPLGLNPALTIMQVTTIFKHISYRGGVPTPVQLLRRGTHIQLGGKFELFGKKWAVGVQFPVPSRATHGALPPHCYTVHLPLGALLTWCAMCGTGALRTSAQVPRPPRRLARNLHPQRRRPQRRGPEISHISPIHLAHISPTSPAHLAHLAHLSAGKDLIRLYLYWQLGVPPAAVERIPLPDFLESARTGPHTQCPTPHTPCTFPRRILRTPRTSQRLFRHRSFVVHGSSACISPGGHVKFWQPDEQPGAECGPGMKLEANFTAFGSFNAELKLEMAMNQIGLATRGRLREMLEESASHAVASRNLSTALHLRHVAAASEETFDEDSAKQLVYQTHPHWVKTWDHHIASGGKVRTLMLNPFTAIATGPHTVHARPTPSAHLPLGALLTWRAVCVRRRRWRSSSR